MQASDRARLIEEVRQRLADIDRHASPDHLGGGWTVSHLRALLEEVDTLRPPPEAGHDPRLNAGRAALIAQMDDIIARAADLVPPAMRQWFLDELRGVTRVGGEVIA